MGSPSIFWLCTPTYSVHEGNSEPWRGRLLCLPAASPFHWDSRLAVSCVRTKLTLPIPAGAPAPYPLQDGVFIHRVRTLSLSRVRHSLALDVVITQAPHFRLITFLSAAVKIKRASQCHAWFSYSVSSANCTLLIYYNGSHCWSISSDLKCTKYYFSKRISRKFINGGIFCCVSGECWFTIIYHTTTPPKKKTHTHAQIYTYGDDVD